ncbi:hypothetical protein, partial [Moritella sp. Urea-trap-13]|uniref:hypothetical protein n=1 Tax=Moritella sp. Urea-trap-13 TaxID=2058327 RepID=UPI0018E2956C
GPVDQKDASDKVNIDLNVTATDKDGDTTDGTLDITLTDGSNAAGGDDGVLTLAEGDLDVDGNGVGGADTTYPASQSGSFVIKAGEDSLVPDSVNIDPALQAALIVELQAELTSGGEALTFSVDGDGNLVGLLNGDVAVTVSLSGEQQGQDVKVTVIITQNVPLDHNGSNNAGYVTSAGDEIHINVPVQATDTDGDDLDVPANVDITITDGANPSFGTDSGVIINESTENGNIISGQIPLDVGSDAIDSIVFQVAQPGLTGITSNGAATTFTVVDNILTVLDSAGEAVMTVTIATDGSYQVIVTGPVDQSESTNQDSSAFTNINLNVTATDADGDSTDGAMDINITDGSNAVGGDKGMLTLDEGDLDTVGDGVNVGDTDTTYPASQSGSFVIQAGEDRLVPDSIVIDPALQAALIAELQAELTSGGEALTFTVDGSGNLIGTLPSGVVAVTVSLSGEQQGQDVKVMVTITQNVPLDHNGTSDGGYVTFEGDNVHINVPVQATDTDGDDLDAPANVDITITDGANLSFGTDSGVTINESTDENKAIEGQIPLNVGSDEIASI